MGVYFGRSNFARITGISMIPMNIMFIVVVPYVAWMQEFITGSYTLPLASIAAVSAVGSVMFLFLGNPRLSPLPATPRRCAAIGNAGSINGLRPTDALGRVPGWLIPGHSAQPMRPR